MRAHASQTTGGGAASVGAGGQTGDRTLQAFLRIPRPLFDLVFGREWFRDPALATGGPVRTDIFEGRAMMTPRTRQVVQGAIGLGLAASLLIWGLPYFAKTSWADIWDVIRTVPLEPGDRLPGAHARGPLVVHLHGHRVPARAQPSEGAHRQPLRLVGVQPAPRWWGGGTRGNVRDLPVVGVLAPSHLDVAPSSPASGTSWPGSRCPVVAIAALWFGGVTLPDALKELAVAGMVTGLAILGALIAIMVSERAAQAIGRVLDRVVGPLIRRRRPASTMSIQELVRDLRARINEVVGSGWWSMTLGMIGYFAAYYLLFVLVMRQTGVTLPLNLLFAAFAIGRLLTTIGITPGGVGVTETATTIVLVGWGADPAGAPAGVVLFSIFTHLMEVPLGALGWLLWTISPKVEAARRGRGGGLRLTALPAHTSPTSSVSVPPTR